MRDLGRRIAELEQRAAPGVLCCFVNDRETTAEAIERQWPDGAPAHSRILFVCWRGEKSKRAGQLR